VTQQIVSPVLNPPGHVDIGRTSVRRIIFEPAILWRVVRGGDDDAVGEMLASPAIVHKDSARDDRRRRHAIVMLDNDVHIIASEDFKRRALSGPGKRVRVPPYEQRAIGAMCAAKVTDGLRDSQNMSFRE
jgi:hypothetical protein